MPVLSTVAKKKKEMKKEKVKEKKLADKVFAIKGKGAKVEDAKKKKAATEKKPLLHAHHKHERLAKLQPEEERKKEEKEEQPHKAEEEAASNPESPAEAASDPESPSEVAPPVAVPRQSRLSPEGRANALIEAAVGGVTELLRLLGVGKRRPVSAREGSALAPEAAPFESLDEVLAALRKDYVERAYFVTGNITDALYDPDCFFADPTVKFTGRDRWKENLRLLVPFLEDPSITLLRIEPVREGGATVVSTRWILRTYLKLPWRPYIDVAGGTTHLLNERLQVVEHVERWKVSSLAAIKQIFVPSQRAWP
ncbi:Histone H2B [Klebsormidium nitens]|uniref:Histone H2B n=1 Tax=Klebsormidium nitens TaxID=105231 RepID=A0A1Y1HTW9_KLENI|nr:Histone H2B [Klebsormidium nitens]|eukprot:GAQ82070.1 Histone H2B [Klebsormidium nitens]